MGYSAEASGFMKVPAIKKMLNFWNYCDIMDKASSPKVGKLK